MKTYLVILFVVCTLLSTMAIIDSKSNVVASQDNTVLISQSGGSASNQEFIIIGGQAK